QVKYNYAERLRWRALYGCERNLGERYLSMLVSMFYSASVLWNPGKYLEAEEMDRRVLKGREKELG
ncbi:hypothetical protein K469DRAFT_515493, partial [Zopfia rhizophila CBS 207.26]